MRLRVRTAIIISSIFACLAVAIAIFYATSQSSFCNRCHEMNANYRAWQSSAHRTVDCEACHLGPDVPNLVIDKFLALKEVFFHFTNAYEKPINKGSQLSERMPSLACTSCHKQPGKVTTDKIKFMHKKHLDAGLKCAFCHNRVGHPKLKAYSERISMQFCMDCHRQKKAPIACDACHPAVSKLKPASHEQGSWMKVHGQTKDTSNCLPCHKDKASFCDGCHGAPVPHPKNWKNNHGQLASTKKDKCLVCHQATQCDTCHRTVNPHPAGWISKHPTFVRANGSTRCNTCHNASFCSNCHRSRNPHPARWRSIHGDQVERSGRSSCLSCHRRSFCDNCHARFGED